MAVMLTRRRLMAVSSVGITTLALPVRAMAVAGPTARVDADPEGSAADVFPAQDPALVRAMVGASHGNVARVKELLRDRPRLANASWDWGFGDWETALGAASHTGSREIALLLIEHGARPDLFSHAMLGHLDVVRAAIAASPGVERIRGPHSITLMQHARAGGDDSTDVVAFLTTLPDAHRPPTDLPLSDELRQAYTGIYQFGSGSSDRLEVGIPKAGAPFSLRRAGGDPRRLFHQGDHAFHPAGAHDTRVVFVLRDGRAASLAISSPAALCTAERVG